MSRSPCTTRGGSIRKCPAPSHMQSNATSLGRGDDRTLIRSPRCGHRAALENAPWRLRVMSRGTPIIVESHLERFLFLNAPPGPQRPVVTIFGCGLGRAVRLCVLRGSVLYVPGGLRNLWRPHPDFSV